MLRQIWSLPCNHSWQKMEVFTCRFLLSLTTQWRLRSCPADGMCQKVETTDNTDYHPCWNGIAAKQDKTENFSIGPTPPCDHTFVPPKNRQLLFCALVLGKGCWDAPCSAPGNKTCCMERHSLTTRNSSFPLAKEPSVWLMLFCSSAGWCWTALNPRPIHNWLLMPIVPRETTWRHVSIASCVWPTSADLSS